MEVGVFKPGVVTGLARGGVGGWRFLEGRVGGFGAEGSDDHDSRLGVVVMGMVKMAVSWCSKAEYGSGGGGGGSDM